jgi:hypothetical protein
MKALAKVFLISLIYTLSSCYQKAEPETFLIPSNYFGKVNILFNQNGIAVKYRNEDGNDTIYKPKIGVPVKYENGRRVYEIPLEGVLLTQFKENDGFIDRQYYSVDSIGKRTLLEVFKFRHFAKDSAGYEVQEPNRKGIFGDGTSGSYGNMHIFFQDFTVCSYNMLDSFSKKEYEMQFDDELMAATGLILYLK